MRELAYIQKIKTLTPIPGADNIECATVLGWELVVKKGEFQVGDLCVYCEIDSILPEYPCFEFLRTKKFRIKTVKLKGQISQGIAFPLSVLTDVDPTFSISKVKVGDDVTQVLKITKYDSEADLDKVEVVKKTWLENKISYLKWKLFGFSRVKTGDFPNDVPKTDETRVQKMSSELSVRQNNKMYITEKCEGTSATFVYRKNGNWLAKMFGNAFAFQACSRNRIVYNSQNNSGETTHHIMQVASKYNLIESMKGLNRNLAVQGEVIGPKIQGNIYKLPELEFRVFLMFDLDTQTYLQFQELIALVNKLNLQMVPILEQNHSLVNDVKYYVDLSKGKSKINSNSRREGIVIRSESENFSFKSINPEYLLHQD